MYDFTSYFMYRVSMTFMVTTEMTATRTPSGISAPLAAINSQDQSGLIAIIAGFALGLALLGVGVKRTLATTSDTFATTTSCSAWQWYVGFGNNVGRWDPDKQRSLLSFRARWYSIRSPKV